MLGRLLEAEQLFHNCTISSPPSALPKAETLLAWAMVYNKVQGATENGTVCLHDLGSRYLKRSHLYVGLSRVTDGGNVFIAKGLE